MIVSGQPKRKASRWLQACVLLCATVVLPLGLAYGQDGSDRTEVYLEEVAAKLQAEIEAGNMTAEEAEDKMTCGLRRPAMKDVAAEPRRDAAAAANTAETPDAGGLHSRVGRGDDICVYMGEAAC